MSQLRVPVTATSMPEWVRQAGGGINATMVRLKDLKDYVAAVEVRVTGTEADIDTLQAQMGAANFAISTLQSDVAALRAAVSALQLAVSSLQLPAKIMMMPSPVPSGPQGGWIYFDSGTNKLMIYDGAAWQAAW